MVERAPLWSVLVLPVVLGGFAVAAAMFDAALAARAEGRRATAGELGEPVRAAARLLVTQRRITVAPDAVLWRLGGGTVVVVALLASVVTPLGRWSVSDLGIGVVWWPALLALLWVAVWLLGWGPNAAYALVSGYRFVAQALAYEMPLAITMVTVAVAAGTLRVGGIVAAQAHLWYGVWMPVALVDYLIGALALAFWGPLRAPVAADTAGGVQAELAGVDRLVFLVGRYLVLAAAAAFAVPLFLGGGAGPLLPDWAWTVLKTLLVLGVLVWARWRLPLVRMDRFEEWSWVVLLPVTLAQLFVVCVVVLVAST
jgi:NADH-quinone oxidoreductase subunit H